MWKISVQMARFPAPCFSRRQAAMAEFPREGLGDGTLCHSREIRGLEERVAPLVFLPGLHLSLRWGEQPLPDLPLPGKAALGHDSQEGGNHWVLGPACWSGRDIPEPLKASPPGGHAQPWGSAAFPCPVPARRPVHRYPRRTRTSVRCPGLSQPQRRRVPPAAGLGEAAARSVQGMVEPCG